MIVVILERIKDEFKAKIVPAASSAFVVFAMASLMGVDTLAAVIFFSLGYLAKSILD